MYHPNLLETKEVAIQRLVLIVPVEEQVHNKQAAKDKPGAYISHYAELRTDEQPRARSTAPSAQSLPSTTRPAGSGALCRAGLSSRLVSLSKIFCLIPFSLCDCYEASKAENTEKDLPLYASLSLLAKMEPHQREGLHNDDGPVLETGNLKEAGSGGVSHVLPLNLLQSLSSLQEEVCSLQEEVSSLQEEVSSLHEHVPLLQGEVLFVPEEPVHDDAGPVQADVRNEGND